MTALNPVSGTKTISGKVGSLQMLLLTAMALLGFYLCFKEIRRISLEMASLRDQVTRDVASAAAAAVAAAAKRDAPPASPPPVIPLDEDIVMVMSDADMDQGIRQMLEHLQRSVPHAADVQEVEEEEEEEEPDAREAMLGKTKGELEELLKQHGVPFKKSDAKAKMVDSLLEAVGAGAKPPAGEA